MTKYIFFYSLSIYINGFVQHECGFNDVESETDVLDEDRLHLIVNNIRQLYANDMGIPVMKVGMLNFNLISKITI